MTTNPDDQVLGELDPVPATDGTEQVYVVKGAQGYRGTLAQLQQLATQVEAEAGTNNAKLMTPLRAKQLLDANLPTVEGTTARAEFEMSGTPGVSATVNISSITDGGAGTPRFNLTNALSSATGAAFVTSARYSNGAQLPVQAGAEITSVSQVTGMCGSNDTGRFDWQKGYFGLFGDLA